MDGTDNMTEEKLSILVVAIILLGMVCLGIAIGCG